MNIAFAPHVMHSSIACWHAAHGNIPFPWQAAQRCMGCHRAAAAGHIKLVALWPAAFHVAHANAIAMALGR